MIGASLPEPEAAARLPETLRSLAGLAVSRVAPAANSIYLWLGPDPTSDDAIGLAIHPPWQLAVPGRDIVSSDEAAHPRDCADAAAYRLQMVRFWRRLDVLKDRRLEQARLVQPQNGLCLAFDGGLVLEQWPCCRGDDDWFEDWNLRFYAHDRRYTVTAEDIVLGTIDGD